ncbi:hypothetical protein [Haladaptatus sp. W1]|uniref:hypothetical protein n=1 Tax=Haladaptatus sp. W1 TaxID=1897478 RepID=UPI000AFBDEA7|nr:hypothetical protein [Haladaptatus sp. W1]
MSRSAASLGLLAFLLVAAVLPAQAAAVSTSDVARFSSQPEHVGTAAFARNNSTVHHENPDDVQSEEDLSELERWLSGRLSSQLGSSTMKIEQGQYEKAHSVLGDDYDDLLSKYVEVSGQTDGTSDDKTAKTLKNAQRSQQQYVSRVQRYRQLYDRYQRAKQNGNDQKARTLARKLERLQKDIDRSSSNLTTNYNRLSNRTNVSTEDEMRRIRNVTQNVSSQQATVREAEFTQTNLTATIRTPNVSFLDPLRVTGRLTDENGTAIGNQSIQLRLAGNRSQRVRTSENGSFSLVGRPAVVSRGNRSFRVEYHPANESTYLGSNATVQANVSPVAAMIDISNHTQQVRYNDTVSVSGRVHAGQVGATDVPVAVFVGKTRVGTTRTGLDGSFSFAETLNASIPAGQNALRVVLPFRHRALNALNVTAPAVVESSPTTLTLSGTAGKARNVNLSGRLNTTNGTPVANQQVSILVNGTQVVSTRTDQNGTYRASLVLSPSLVSADGNATFVAQFDGRGKNVESARTATEISVTDSDDGPLDSTTRGWLVGLGVASLITLGGFFLWRSDIGGGDIGGGDIDDGESDRMATNAGTVSPSDATTADFSVSAREFLDRARSAREAGEFETAVEMGYAATRNQFDAVVPTAASTHWEFYNACREADLADETLTTIADVTEQYEQAAFTTNRVSRETATAVIDAASTLVEECRSPVRPDSSVVGGRIRPRALGPGATIVIRFHSGYLVGKELSASSTSVLAASMTAVAVSRLTRFVVKAACSYCSVTSAMVVSVSSARSASRQAL